MEKPLVSVICACYNQSKYVTESLESVKNQTYSNLEIIIWDDSSADDSVKIIENWIFQNKNLKIIFIKNKQNFGICKSLNNAYSKANGKYIQMLALDDILLCDKIERHVEILEKSSEKEGLVFTDAYLINDKSEFYQNKFIAYHKKYLNLKSGNFFEELLIGNFIPAMSIFYKSEIFAQVGKWDENLIFEDYDMILRIAKSFDFIFDDQPSVKYRFHENNTHSSFSKEINNSLYSVYIKYINHNESINLFLKSHLIKKYKEKKLKTEQLQYFKILPPKNLRERWLMANKNIILYKFVDKLATIKNFLIYN